MHSAYNKFRGVTKENSDSASYDYSGKSGGTRVVEYCSRKYCNEMKQVVDLFPEPTLCLIFKYDHWQNPTDEKLRMIVKECVQNQEKYKTHETKVVSDNYFDNVNVSNISSNAKIGGKQ